MWIRLTSYGATSRMARSLPLEQVRLSFGRCGLQEEEMMVGDGELIDFSFLRDKH